MNLIHTEYTNKPKIMNLYFKIFLKFNFENYIIKNV